MAFKDANHLRPRRGSVTGMASSTIVLAAGELFLEYPQTGVGTGASKIKIGDGVTQYKDLPYAIDLAEMGGSTVDFTTDTSTTVAEALAKVVSGQTLSVDVAALKQAVNLLNGEAVKTITSTGSTITVTGSGNSINIEANPTGAISTVYDTDLTASKAVVSNASGKLVSATATAAEVDYLSGVTSAVQTQINGKQATITGAATSITDTDLTASMALVSDASGKVAAAANTTAAEIGYVHGVTSAIQTQINGKANTSHTHTEADLVGGLSVSQLTDGGEGLVIDIDLLPKAAVERLYIAADEAALRALTSADVQNGDTVKVQSGTLGGQMYFVKDDENLPVGEGQLNTAFEVYTVGSASSVPWSGVTDKPAEIGYLMGVTSSVQGQINDKQDTITGAATSITDTDLTASMAVVSDANGKVAVSAVTATELGYVSGVTSAIQTQINGKSDNGHTHTMSEVTDLYGDFTGATSAAAGATGFVPAPAAGDEDKYLAGNGSWVAFTTATTAADGLMSATDKAFIEGLKAADAYDFGDETPSV